MTLKNIFLVAVAIQSAVAFAEPVSGSPDAAVQVGKEFVQLLFGTAPDQVKVGSTSFHDNAASLQVRTPVTECDLELIKNAAGNKYGWVVQLHTCKKLK